MSDDLDPDLEPRPSLLVAFGGLTNEQRAVIDAHPLRAPGAFIPSISGALLATFWVGPDSTVEATYDDLRGWALGHGIPIHQVIEEFGPGDQPSD